MRDGTEGVERVAAAAGTEGTAGVAAVPAAAAGEIAAAVAEGKAAEKAADGMLPVENSHSPPFCLSFVNDFLILHLNVELPPRHALPLSLQKMLLLPLQLQLQLQSLPRHLLKWGWGTKKKMVFTIYYYYLLFIHSVYCGVSYSIHNCLHAPIITHLRSSALLFA